MVYSERYGFIHIGRADTAAALFQATDISVPWFANKKKLADPETSPDTYCRWL
jgi:hypothetical protein